MHWWVGKSALKKGIRCLWMAIAFLVSMEALEQCGLQRREVGRTNGISDDPFRIRGLEEVGYFSWGVFGFQPLIPNRLLDRDYAQDRGVVTCYWQLNKPHV
jgi:hypothetical protein